VSELRHALAEAGPGQRASLIDTLGRILLAVNNALDHDPTLPLQRIEFTRNAAVRHAAAFTQIDGTFKLAIDVGTVLDPQGFDDWYAHALANGDMETGTGDVWTDVMLHEIIGHGSQMAWRGWGGPVDLRVAEHLDAAFEALTAAREIPPDRGVWGSQLSKASRDTADASKLNEPEALAGSAVVVLGNPDSDWRSVQYALYRALRGMPPLDAAEVQRFQVAELLGVEKPHLHPAKVAVVLAQATDSTIAAAELAAAEPIDIPPWNWVNAKQLRTLRTLLRGVDPKVRDRTIELAIAYTDYLSPHGVRCEMTVDVEPDRGVATLRFAFHTSAEAEIPWPQTVRAELERIEPSVVLRTSPEEPTLLQAEITIAAAADQLAIDLSGARDVGLVAGREHADGEPVPGSLEWYRLQDVATREVNLEHATTLDEVLLRCAIAPGATGRLIDRLANDLSGRYGQYLVTFDGVWDNFDSTFKLRGKISRDGKPVGTLRITSYLDEQLQPVAFLRVEGVTSEPVSGRAQLYRVLGDALRPYLERSEADGVGELLRAGEPVPGSLGWYRRQDVNTRKVNLEHATTLDEVLLQCALAPKAVGRLIEELTDDLSGRYGQYLVTFGDWDNRDNSINLWGKISRDSEQLGQLVMSCRFDQQGELVVFLRVEGVNREPVSGRAQLYRVLGDALRPYLERSGADAVGELLRAGEPVPGSLEWYRRQDVATREVNLEHATTLDEVLLQCALAPGAMRRLIGQLTDDLSGRYGQYLVTFGDWDSFDDTVKLRGKISRDGEQLGQLVMSCRFDEQRQLVVFLRVEGVNRKPVSGRAQLYRVLGDALRPYLERSEADAVGELLRAGEPVPGSLEWYRRQDVATREVNLEHATTLDEVLLQCALAPKAVGRLIDELADDLSGRYGQYLVTFGDWDSFDDTVKLRGKISRNGKQLGELVVNCSSDEQRRVVVFLQAYDVYGEPVSDRAQPYQAIGDALRPYFERTLQSETRNCAFGVAAELSARYGEYGREFRILAELTREGVPARALFEAANSAAEFATYAEVYDRLVDMPDGSSAILASKWADGSGGHVFLAVKEHGEVWLVDGHSRQKLPWPPSWGQDAVSRTAVGYLDHNGRPLRPLDEVPEGLTPADAIGMVAGRRDADRGSGWGDSSSDQGVPGELHVDPAVVAVADEMLAQRGVTAVDELVHPLDDPVAAVERAAANGPWWDGLSKGQRRALIAAYPRQIGHADGVAPLDRHEALSVLWRRHVAVRDALVARRDNGIRLSRSQVGYIKRISRIEAAWREAEQRARRAGVGGPYWWAFDLEEFNGQGRAAVWFAHDPNSQQPDLYQVKSVSWSLYGLGTRIDNLPGAMLNAFNHLESTRQADPTVSAASMAWIGYQAPYGWGALRVLGHTLARVGGRILYSEIKAFNAARDARTGDGSHFSNNHVFGKSYGATVIGYAGQGGQLAGEVRSVSAIASPGMGPIEHASEFGDGVAVYAFGSWQDIVTILGGAIPGSMGRFFGFRLGADPLMESFGADVRGTAESGRGFVKAHGSYHDAGSESGRNFGRIPPGRPVEAEAYRIVRRWGPFVWTHDPAAQRRARLDRGTGSHVNCLFAVAAAYSARYPKRALRIGVQPTPEGVRAVEGFIAANSASEFVASYTEIRDRLVALGPGSSAIVVSAWVDRPAGGAFFAVNDGGDVFLLDPKAGKRYPLPPAWENEVKIAAVGYFDKEGIPLRPLSRHAPAFRRDQKAYRAQDPATRRALPCYAELLGVVLDNPTQEQLDQLAEDLSGFYGPYRIKLSGRIKMVSAGVKGVQLLGKIFDGDKVIGSIERTYFRDSEGKLVAHHNLLRINKDFRFKGFSKALYSEHQPLYVESEVDRVEQLTREQGFRAAARRGATWNLDPEVLQKSFDDIKDLAARLSPRVSADARDVLDRIVERLTPEYPGLWPTPIELVELTTLDEPRLGHRLVDGAKASLVQHLRGVEAYRGLYRPGDPQARPVDTSYAPSVAVAVDNAADQWKPDRLAIDLSGAYGRYGVRARGVGLEDLSTWVNDPLVRRRSGVYIGGDIERGDRTIGRIQLVYFRDNESRLVALHKVNISDESVDLEEFLTALDSKLEPLYARDRVGRVEVWASGPGAYALALCGYDLHPDAEYLPGWRDSLEDSAHRLLKDIGPNAPEAHRVLDNIVQQLDRGQADLPQPSELAALTTSDAPNLGRQLLTATTWRAVKHPRAPPAYEPTTDKPDRLAAARDVGLVAGHHPDDGAGLGEGGSDEQEGLPARHADRVELNRFPPPAADDTYGSWLRKLRCIAGVSQKWLAEKSGYSEVYVSQIERGRRVPRRTARALLKALRVPPAEREQGLRKFYPTIDTTLAKHHTFGSWLRALRSNADFTRKQLAEASGYSEDYIFDIENGIYDAPYTAAHKLLAALKVPPAEREQGLRKFYPTIDATLAKHHTFGSWLRALRSNAHFTRKQLAEASGYSEQYISSIERGRRSALHHTARALLVALEVPEELQDEGLRKFDPDHYRLLSTAPADHTLGSWVAAHLHNRHWTQKQLATAVGLDPTSVGNIIRDEFTPYLRTFRKICDVLDIHGPARIDAVRSFYSPLYPIGADSDEIEELFWRLVNTRVVDSLQEGEDRPQEWQLRDRIYERYARIPERVARRWVPKWALELAERPDYEQAAGRAMLTAIVNHTPTSPFTAHAFASCRGAIHEAIVDALFERYPNVDRRDRRIAIAVVAHLGRVNPALTFDDRAYFGAAVNRADDIAAELGLTRADVTHALQILSQPTAAIDQPATGRSGEEIQRQFADPTSATGFEDSDFVGRVRAALAGLPHPNTATWLVILHLVRSVPLDEAAQQLGLSQETAAEIISAALPRLRTAFQPPPDEHAHVDPAGDP
jgi:transcriptional regulator with XRE-family HTH domain